MRISFALWAAYLLIFEPSIGTFDPAWPEPSRSWQSHAQLSSVGLAFASNSDPARVASPRVQSSDSGLDELVRRVPICILWNRSWAGSLGETMLYRVQQIDQNAIRVGYFAYWSTERPWGDNGLTRWLLPAFAIDAFYSHLLFVLPGLQRLLYGPGDVEGVRVVYQLQNSARLLPMSILADDESHNHVAIDLTEAIDETGSILLFNDVWSHQLGGRRALSRARNGAERRCYSQDSLVPLTNEVVSAFRLGGPGNPRRAGPAWRED